MSVITSGVGRLGKDPIVRQVDGGEVVGFSLAMDHGFGSKRGTLWFDCTGWGNRFAALGKRLKKGEKVFVTGEQGERTHDGKVYKTLRLSDVTLLSLKPQSEA